MPVRQSKKKKKNNIKIDSFVVTKQKCSFSSLSTFFGIWSEVSSFREILDYSLSGITCLSMYQNLYLTISSKIFNVWHKLKFVKL